MSTFARDSDTICLVCHHALYISISILQGRNGNPGVPGSPGPRGPPVSYAQDDLVLHCHNSV